MSGKVIKNRLWIWLPCLMIMICFACFGCEGVDEEVVISEEPAAVVEDEEAIIDEEPFDDDEEEILPDEAEAEEIAEEETQAYEPVVIAALDADYSIDYKNGTIPIGDLDIGTRVVDPSWQWEFRTGQDYAREEGDETKPITWLVVAKNHYDGLRIGPHGPYVTLLSEELIGRYDFSETKPVNHWGASDLRSWLNSAGFYQAFSEDFKQAVLPTTVPNKLGSNGGDYSTQDKVFIPSTTELGDTEHHHTFQIGSAYAYFKGASDAKRKALLGGKAWWYWTRSPVFLNQVLIHGVPPSGNFDILSFTENSDGVRPALNLKADTLVSEISD